MIEELRQLKILLFIVLLTILVMALWVSSDSRKPKHKQITFCHCSCGNELVANHKECYQGEDTLVHYTCICGKKSAWDFYAPAPILIEEE